MANRVAVPTETLVPYSWVILGVSLAVQTASSFGNQSIGPLAPFLQSDLGLGPKEVGLISSAVFGGAFVSMSWGGRLSDRFGVRVLFVGGLLILVLFTFLAAIANRLPAGLSVFPFLLVFMLLSGIGNGLSLPPTTRAIMFWFPTRIRAIAMSVKQTGVALAGTITAATLPAIGLQFGWSGGLLAVAIASLVVALIALVGYRESPAEREARTGATAKNAVGMRDLLRERGFQMLGVVSFLYAAVQLSIVTFLVLYLQNTVSLSVIEAGGYLALAQLSGVFARIGWGIVSDLVFGGRRKIVLGIIGVCTVAALILLARLPTGAPGWLIALLMIVVGASAIGWNGVNITFVAEIAGRDRSATAAGLNLTASYLGIMVGPPFCGWILEQTGSYPLMIVILAGVMAVAVGVLSRVRPPTLGRPVNTPA